MPKPVTAAAAVLSAALTSGGMPAAPPTPAGARVEIVGGSAAQRQLARLTALRVAGPTLRRVVFRSPSLNLRREGVRGSELVVSHSKETLRSDWEEQLYVGVYLALAERWPRARVAAAAADHMEAPVDRFRAYDVFSRPPASAVRDEARLLVDAAAASRAKLIELRIASAPARAIELTVRVTDAAAFLRHRATGLLSLLDRPRIPLLGYYLGVEDGSGRVVWATSQLPGTGGVFAIPSLDACSPVGHSEPAFRQPPPCPAP